MASMELVEHALRGLGENDDSIAYTKRAQVVVQALEDCCREGTAKIVFKACRTVSKAVETEVLSKAVELNDPRKSVSGLAVLAGLGATIHAKPAVETYIQQVSDPRAMSQAAKKDASIAEPLLALAQAPFMPSRMIERHHRNRNDVLDAIALGKGNLNGVIGRTLRRWPRPETGMRLGEMLYNCSLDRTEVQGIVQGAVAHQEEIQAIIIAGLSRAIIDDEAIAEAMAKEKFKPVAWKALASRRGEAAAVIALRFLLLESSTETSDDDTSLVDAAAAWLTVVSTPASDQFTAKIGQMLLASKATRPEAHPLRLVLALIDCDPFADHYRPTTTTTPKDLSKELKIAVGECSGRKLKPSLRLLVFLASSITEPWPQQWSQSPAAIATACRDPRRLKSCPDQRQVLDIVAACAVGVHGLAARHRAIEALPSLPGNLGSALWRLYDKGDLTAALKAYGCGSVRCQALMFFSSETFLKRTLPIKSHEAIDEDILNGLTRTGDKYCQLRQACARAIEYCRYSKILPLLLDRLEKWPHCAEEQALLELRAWSGQISTKDDAPALWAEAEKQGATSSAPKTKSTPAPQKPKKKNKDDLSLLLGTSSTTTKKAPATSTNTEKKKISAADPSELFANIVKSKAVRGHALATEARGLVRAVQAVAALAPHVCRDDKNLFLFEATKRVAALDRRTEALAPGLLFGLADEACSACFACLVESTNKIAYVAGAALVSAEAEDTTGFLRLATHIALEATVDALRSNKASSALERWASKLGSFALFAAAKNGTRRPAFAIECLRLGNGDDVVRVKALCAALAAGADDKEPAAALLELVVGKSQDCEQLLEALLASSAVIDDAKPVTRAASAAACLYLATKGEAVPSSMRLGLRLWLAAQVYDDEDEEDESKESDSESSEEEEEEEAVSESLASRLVTLLPMLSKSLLPSDVFGEVSEDRAAASPSATARALASAAWSRLVLPALKSTDTLNLGNGVRASAADVLEFAVDGISETRRLAARRCIRELSSKAENLKPMVSALRHDFEEHLPQTTTSTKSDTTENQWAAPGADPVAEARAAEARRKKKEAELVAASNRRLEIVGALTACLGGSAAADVLSEPAVAMELLSWVRERGLQDADPRVRAAALDLGLATVDANADAALDALLAEQFDALNPSSFGVVAMLGRAAKSLEDGDTRVGDLADRLVAALVAEPPSSSSVPEKPRQAIQRKSSASSASVKSNNSATASKPSGVMKSNISLEAVAAGRLKGGVGIGRAIPKNKAHKAASLRTSLTAKTEKKLTAAELQQQNAENHDLKDVAPKPVAVDADAAQAAVADGLVPLAKALKKQGVETAAAVVDRLQSLCYGEDCLGTSTFARRGAGRGLAAMVKGLGIAALKQRNVVKRIEAALEASVVDEQHGGLVAIECLTGRMGLLFEPYGIALFPMLLRAFQADGSLVVREAAFRAGKTLFHGLSAHGVKLALPTLLSAASNEDNEKNEASNKQTWRRRVAALGMLGASASAAPKQLGAVLPRAVPALTSALADTHPRVREAAREALGEVANVAKNPEIRYLKAILLDALCEPAQCTRPALDALLGREYAHALDAASIALVMPILVRGLRDRTADTRRCAAVLAGNLALMTAPGVTMTATEALQPSLEDAAVVDASPEVRRAAALALGQLVAALGDLPPKLLQRLAGAALGRQNPPEIGDIIARKLNAEQNEGVLAGAAQGASERSGAAQALAVVAIELSIGAKVVRETAIPAVNASNAATREGAQYILRYLAQCPDLDYSLVPEVLQANVVGLADDSDGVREAAFLAGKMLVRHHGRPHLAVLLPNLEAQLGHSQWRIRASAAVLLGELLCLVGDARRVGFAETELDDDTGLGDQEAAEAIREAVGVHKWRNILASLYIARLDSVSAVRHAAVQVWKTVVPNTPKALRDILQNLVRRLVSMLTPDSSSSSSLLPVSRLGHQQEKAPKAKSEHSENDDDESETSSEGDLEAAEDATAERQRVGSRTLGDIVKKMGDRVLPELVPLLVEAFDQGDDATRIGVCLGLAEVCAASSAQEAAEQLNVLAPAILDALLDDSPAVASHGALAFRELHKCAGKAAVEAVLPSLLSKLDKDDDDSAVRAIGELARKRSRELVQLLVPSLLSARPLSPARGRALAALAHSAGAAVAVYVGSIIRAVVADVIERRDEDSSEKLLDSAARVAAAAALSGDAAGAVGQLASSLTASAPESRAASAQVAALFFATLGASADDDEDIAASCGRVLKLLLAGLADTEINPRRGCVDALTAYAAAFSIERQATQLELVRITLASTASEVRFSSAHQKAGEDAPLLPGLALEDPPRDAVKALYPIYLHVLLKASAEERTAAADGIAELVELASPATLKKHAVKIAGPLIRVVGDRWSPELKAAVLNALASLLRLAPTSLKAFVPQLQATYIKHLKESPPPRSLSSAWQKVRNKALLGLGHLAPLSPRLDALLKDLAAAATASRENQDDDPSSDSRDLQRTLLKAITTVITNRPAKRFAPEAIAAVTEAAELLAEADNESVVKSAEALLEAVREYNSSD